MHYFQRPNKKSTTTISKPDKIEIADVKQNLPTFDLESLDQFNTIHDAALAEIILDTKVLTSKTDMTSKPKEKKKLYLHLHKDPKYADPMQFLSSTVFHSLMPTYSSQIQM